MKSAGPQSTGKPLARCKTPFSADLSPVVPHQPFGFTPSFLVCRQNVEHSCSSGPQVVSSHSRQHHQHLRQQLLRGTTFLLCVASGCLAKRKAGTRKATLARRQSHRPHGPYRRSRMAGEGVPATAQDTSSDPLSSGSCSDQSSRRDSHLWTAGRVQHSSLRATNPQGKRS